MRRAYLRLLVRAHPDKGGSPRRFGRLQHAYAVLSDPSERAIYDDRLERAGDGGAAGPARPAPAAGGGGLHRGAGVRRQNGVTAVVHGQRRGPPPPSGHAQQRPEKAAWPAGDPAAEPTVRRGALLASGAPEPRRLAEAYLERAAAHQRMGRLHHALFDAEEAAAALPGSAEADRLLGALSAQAAADVVGDAAQGGGAAAALSFLQSDSEDSDGGDSLGAMQEVGV